MIIMPILIILWFTGLAFVLLLIAKDLSINEVVLISAATIGAIRILAYFKVEISKDLAKLFPLIALSLFLLSPGEFSLEKIFSQVTELPILLNNIILYIFVVVAIEIVLRVIFTAYDFWASEEEAAKEEIISYSISAQ